MKQLNHWRNRILALSLCLLFLISALLFLPGNYSARVQAEAPPFAWNDAPVSFTENENDEFSQLTVEIFYFDTATGSYVKLADKAFLAPTGSEISYNPPQIEGFRYEGGFSAITNKLEKGKTTVKLVFIPEGVEADHPNFEVVHVDELPEQPNEPSETPGEPSETPGEPSETPGEPSETPGEPSETPGEPSDTPGEPSDTPGEPSETPGEPSETPGKPSETPGGDPSETPAEKPSEGETDPSQDESEAEQPEIVKEAEVDLGDSSDLDKEKKAELYLEIYLIDKEGKLKKVKVPYLITEGVAGQKYKFSAPELAGYELISDPLKELLEGALVEGRKQISVVYKAKDAKLSEAKINKLIAGLLDKDGNYLSTESEIPESKPTTGESEKETDKPSKPTKTPKPSKETKPSKESKPSKPEKTDPPSKPNYNYPQFNYPPYRPSRPIDMNFPSVGRPQGPKFTLPPVILPQQVQPQSSRDPVQLDPIDKASGPTVKPVDDKLINFSTQPGASAESERPQKTMKIEPQKERESDSKIFIFFGLLLGLGLAGVATAVVYFAGKKK